MRPFARAGYVTNIIFSVIDKGEKLFVVYFLRLVIEIIEHTFFDLYKIKSRLRILKSSSQYISGMDAVMKSDQSLLRKHVEFLTTLRPFRNYQNVESLGKVCQYLANEFHNLRLQVSDQPFIANRVEFKNIIGTYNSSKKRRLIVGAHYDVCGDQPGADDNASAVSGLLETARMVAEAQPDIDYRIDFVAYCLEEPPFYDTNMMGSYHHAESISSIKSDVIGLINFEMIGYYHNGPQPYPDPRLAQIYPATADFIAVVGKHDYHEFNQKVYELMRVDAEINVQMIDNYLIESLAGMSDQRSYWRFGIPALMINDTSFIRNPNYHRISDDLDTLSFGHMAATVSAVYKAIVGF